MDRLVVDGYGKYVGLRGNQIVVKDKGKVLFYELAENLRQVIITGHGSIGFDAINLLAQHGVDLITINWRGEVTARLASPEMRTVSTRREQYYAYNDHRSGHLARNFILAKLRNQYAALGTLAKTRKETHPNEATQMLTAKDKVAEQMKTLEERIPDLEIEKTREKIMGTEGIATANYWAAIKLIIPDEFNFNDRSGRYATDPINAMLNYGYGILEGECWRAVHYAGLDPHGGFLHADRPGKPSMVLDLMEEFRQQVVDKQVTALIARKMLSPQDFEYYDNPTPQTGEDASPGATTPEMQESPKAPAQQPRTVRKGTCKLSDKARKTLIQEIVGRFEEYTRAQDIKIRWCDLILRQAREVAKYLRKETTRYEGFYLRW